MGSSARCVRRSRKLTTKRAFVDAHDAKQTRQAHGVPVNTSASGATALLYSTLLLHMRFIAKRSMHVQPQHLCASTGQPYR